MIWRNHRVLTCLCALFALCLGSFVFTHSSASALDSGWVSRGQTSVERVVRTSWGTLNIENNTSVGTQNIPWMALGANDGSSYNRYLWGWLLYNDLTSYNYTYEDYTTLQVILSLSGTAGRDVAWASCLGGNNNQGQCNLTAGPNTTIIVYDDHNASKEVQCYADNGYQGVTFKLICSVNLEVGHNPVGYHIRMRPLDNVALPNPATYNFWIPPNGSENLAITSILQKVVSDSDPLKGLLAEGNVITENISNSVSSIYDITLEYYEAVRELDELDRQLLELQSQDATAQGNSASTGASGATSSILGVITGIYNTLLHPVTTNCVISGVQVYDLNLGNLDFCTGFDIPQPIFAIGALIMVGLIVLLGWSILHAGMGLYNEVFGGKS